MRMVIRSVAAACLALFGTVVLAVAWTAATAVQLTATALIMGGTFHPLSTPPDDPVSYVNPYLKAAVDEFINPAAAVPSGTGQPGIASVGAEDARYAVVTPEEFFPLGSRTFDKSVSDGLANLRNCVRGTGCVVNRDPAIDPQPPAGPPAAGDEFSIFGYSQSAVIASLLKRELIENPGETPPVTSYFLLANPMRPNGGILARSPFAFTIPILGVSFVGATPTDSCEQGQCMPTVDVASQYDPMGGDAPASLTNLLAIVNAAAGYYYLHGESQYSSFDDAVYQGSYGDTDYYLYPTERLPILMPFGAVVPSPILTALNAPLKAAIEGAFRRDLNPGVVTTVSLLPFHDPIRTVINILVAIPTGIDDGLAEFTGDPDFRPLGTAPVTSPYGVGGPELPAPPEEEDTESGVALRTASDDDETVDADATATSDPPAEPAEPERPKVRGPISFDSREDDDPPVTEDVDVVDTAPDEPTPTDDTVDTDDDEAAEDADDDAADTGDGEAAA